MERRGRRICFHKGPQPRYLTGTARQNYNHTTNPNFEDNYLLLLEHHDEQRSMQPRSLMRRFTQLDKGVKAA